MNNGGIYISARVTTKKYTFFTGCIIPSRFPFIELASRKVLESLGIKIEDLEDASCCPNQMAIQSSDKKLWYTLAARNLCLAEGTDNDLLTLCNGCYDTLKTVNSALKADDELRQKVNEQLKTLGLEFKGSIEVKHILQVLHDDIGTGKIEKSTSKPLNSLKIAPFEGCHAMRPMDHMGFDNQKDRKYLSDIIKAMSGKVVDYPEHNSCCGGGLSIARADDVAPAVKNLVNSAKCSGASSIIVSCPFCFAQLLRGQALINETYIEKTNMPIFYITEIMALTMGFKPEEIGLPLHYEMSVGEERKIVDTVLGERGEIDMFTDEITRSQLETCLDCMACADDCPTAMATSDYHPEDIVRLVLEAKIDEVLERNDIWYCMNCHECIDKCPQDFGLVKLLVRLKNLAIERGTCPEIIERRLKTLAMTGYSFERDEEAREKLGLPSLEGADVEDIKHLLIKSKSKGRIEESE